MRLYIVLVLSLTLFSCSTHQKSNFKVDEEFVVELKKPASRGAVVDIAIQGIFLGANYFAEKSAKSLTTSYSRSISINDYYNVVNDKVEKTYNKIEIKKYSKPTEEEQKAKAKQIVTESVNSLPKTRGVNSIRLEDVVREENDDLMNFKAVIELVSDEENPGVTRLSLNELYIFFSKTKVYSDEDLNAKISISIEGQWRSTDGSPMKATLIEQEFDLKRLKYSAENQIKEPLLSPWYYDIPIISQIEGNSKYGVINVKIELVEYEGNKSKYVNKLPGILSDNKSKIVKDGANAVEKMME